MILLMGSDRSDRKYNLSFTYCIINFINTYKYIYLKLTGNLKFLLMLLYCIIIVEYSMSFSDQIMEQSRLKSAMFMCGVMEKITLPVS